SLTALQFFFATSLGMIKCSIVLLLMRIFFTKKFKTFGEFPPGAPLTMDSQE
ncbi:MAG: hypothetical protein Q9183_007149, partial [Haloplaca sp. 2 TL-2023]